MSTNNGDDDTDDPSDELPPELRAEIDYTTQSLRKLAKEHGVDVDAIDDAAERDG